MSDPNPAEMLEALKLCDRYFMSCASAAAASGQTAGQIKNPPLDLQEMCEEAAGAVAKILHPDWFK